MSSHLDHMVQALLSVGHTWLPARSVTVCLQICVISASILVPRKWEERWRGRERSRRKEGNLRRGEGLEGSREGGREEREGGMEGGREGGEGGRRRGREGEGGGWKP